MTRDVEKSGREIIVKSTQLSSTPTLERTKGELFVRVPVQIFFQSINCDKSENIKNVVKHY